MIIDAAKNKTLSDRGCLSLNVELNIDLLINGYKIAKL